MPGLYRPVCSPPSVIGHNYIGRNYTGHDYIGHSYTGHNHIGNHRIAHKCLGHNYTGHGYAGHRSMGHNYTGVPGLGVVRQQRRYGPERLVAVPVEPRVPLRRDRRRPDLEVVRGLVIIST